MRSALRIGELGLSTGDLAALGAAILFGAGTPLAKLLLHTNPWLLATRRYLGSGVGLWIVRRIRRAPPVHIEKGDWRRLAGAIVAGGTVGPLLLLFGLLAMPASGATNLVLALSTDAALHAHFPDAHHLHAH